MLEQHYQKTYNYWEKIVVLVGPLKDQNVVYGTDYYIVVIVINPLDRMKWIGYNLTKGD